MIMDEEWTVELLEGEVPWSDAWAPDTRRIEIDGALLRELIELDAGDHSLFRTLVEMLRHDVDVHLPALAEAAAASDTACLTNIAHSLAGESAQIGASSLATHCRAIESAAIREDFALVGQLLGAVEAHLDRFVAAVERELDRRSGA
jgi:HPt (histidine-containing phosphotransfer) domain-containing protein